MLVILDFDLSQCLIYFFLRKIGFLSFCKRRGRLNVSPLKNVVGTIIDIIFGAHLSVFVLVPQINKSLRLLVAFFS